MNYQNQTDTNTIVNSYMGSPSSTLQTPANTSNSSSTAAKQQQNQTIIGVFKSRPNAEQAVNSLRQQGFNNEEINIIAKNQQQQQNQQQGMGFDDDITDGTLTGGTIGGIGGLLLGAGALLIPGVGPILAAGPITGAIGGAIAGGIAGGLIDWGIPAEESQRYQQEVVQGNILAIIRTNSTKTNSVAQILRQNGANEVKTHSK